MSGGVSRFTAEELAELAAFDAEVDATPVTADELRESRSRDRVLENVRQAESNTYRTRQLAAHRKYHASHRDELNAKQRARYAANAERERARSAAWRSEHGDELRDYRAAYDAAHREQRRAASKRWRENNPDKVAAYRNKKRKEECQ